MTGMILVQYNIDLLTNQLRTTNRILTLYLIIAIIALITYILRNKKSKK